MEFGLSVLSVLSVLSIYLSVCLSVRKQDDSERCGWIWWMAFGTRNRLQWLFTIGSDTPTAIIQITITFGVLCRGWGMHIALTRVPFYTCHF